MNWLYEHLVKPVVRYVVRFLERLFTPVCRCYRWLYGSSPNSLDGLADRFRKRARRLTFGAILSLLLAVVILGVGLTFFLHYSSDIALQDAQKRAMVQEDDALSQLANLYATESQLQQHLTKLNESLPYQEQRVRSLGDVHPGPEREWVRRQPYGKASTPDAVVRSIDDLLRYLDTPEAEKDEARKLNRERQNLEGNVKSAREAVTRAENEVNRLSGEDPNSVVVESAKVALKEAEEFKALREGQLIALDETPLTERLLAFKATAKAMKEELAQRARDKQQNLEQSTASLAATRDELAQAEEELARTKAQIVRLSGDEPSAEVRRDDVIFAVTANLTRAGTVVVVIVLATMFLSVHRYALRLAGYYNARADVLDLCAVGKPDLLDEFRQTVDALSPDKLDYESAGSDTPAKVVKAFGPGFGD